MEAEAGGCPTPSEEENAEDYNKKRTDSELVVDGGFRSAKFDSGSNALCLLETGLLVFKPSPRWISRSTRRSASCFSMSRNRFSTKSPLAFKVDGASYSFSSSSPTGPHSEVVVSAAEGSNKASIPTSFTERVRENSRMTFKRNLLTTSNDQHSRIQGENKVSSLQGNRSIRNPI